MTLLKASLAAAAILLCFGEFVSPAQAASEKSVAVGKELVELNCSSCHGVGLRDASPHADAPAFRTILQRYPIDALEEAFDSGVISSGHPDMPDFLARPDQVDAILYYFLSIQEH